jgi:membrane fusion protein (multidrug efflux system)
MLSVAGSRIISCLGIVLAVLCGCSRDSASGAGAAAGLPPPPVKVVRVQARDLPLYRDFVGQTRGKQDVEVRARVQGYLQTINFRQGGDVKSGDLLFTIDRRPYQAALAQAKAAEAQLRSQYQQAQSDAERYAQLTKTGVISKQQAEQTASQAKAAGAALDAQLAVVNAKQVDLTYTEIRAPISGRIGLTPYSVGDLVGTATGTEKPLATISELDSVLVRFAISETDYLRYLQDHPDAAKNVDQPRTITDLRLTLADGSVYPHPGMITRADNVIDSASGTLTVEAQFPNPERTLRAGQYAKIRVGSRVLKNAIAVPARAVQEQQGIASVRVVGDDNHVESREVQIADRSSDFWALASGLKPGERVVVEGLTKALPGTIVKPEEVTVGAPAVTVPATLAPAPATTSAKP